MNESIRYSTHLIALACVVGIASGQVLFKFCAQAFREYGLWATQTLALFVLSAMLYAVTTIVWIWILAHAELGKVYPIMALAFVFVPLASFLVFGERFSQAYLIGLVMIVVGVGLTVRG
jgi:drug/metabolite transporter (DMT)-like permease